MNMLPYSGFPALPDKMEDMHKQLVALGLNDVEALTARIKKCEDWVDNVEETEQTGNPVEFQNALALPATSLETTINAIQDLHGYDHPWAGGAGKNKCNPSAETVTIEASITNAVNIGEIVLNDTTSIIASWYQNAAINGSADRNTIYLRLKNSPSTIYYAANVTTVPLNAGTHESPINNVPAGTYDVVLWAQNCTTGYVASQFMVRLATETDPTFAPYSNICPISGRDSVVVERTSANYVTEYLNGNNVISDGSIVSNEQYSLALLPVKQGETYTASHNTESYWVWAFYRSKPTIGSVSYNNDRTLDTISASKTFTAPIDGYIAIRVPVAYRELMVNGGSTALPYEPSYATDFTIQLGTTVYGGSLNVTTGVMTVTHSIITIDGNTNIQTNGATSESSRFGLYVSGKRNGYTNILSNIFITNLSAIGSAGTMLGREANTFVEFCLPPDVAQTVEAGQAWFGDNNTQLCYELATPTTIQLTPTQLEMLKGYNRVSSEDADSLIVKAYTGGPWKPITRAIKKLTNKTKTTKKRRK